MPCKVEMKYKGDVLHSLKINGAEVGKDCHALKLEWSSENKDSAKITLELSIDELDMDEMIEELEINNKLIGVEPINDRHEILDL